MTPWEADKFIPNPYSSSRWYPLDREGYEVRRTQGRGKNAGRSYMHARVKVWVNIVDSKGNVIDKRHHQDYEHFRACLADKEPRWRRV